MKREYFGKFNEAEGTKADILFIPQQFNLPDVDIISLIISSTVRKSSGEWQEGRLPSTYTNCGAGLWAGQGVQMFCDTVYRAEDTDFLLLRFLKYLGLCNALGTPTPPLVYQRSKPLSHKMYSVFRF